MTHGHRGVRRKSRSVGRRSWRQQALRLIFFGDAGRFERGDGAGSGDLCRRTSLCACMCRTREGRSAVRCAQGRRAWLA
ncbi:hypothetical protein LG3211_0938 [Lysobacter gummosus]|nr:hypothetical protein LG3211_0938 [Lysobacter gummosus]